MKNHPSDNWERIFDKKNSKVLNDTSEVILATGGWWHPSRTDERLATFKQDEAHTDCGAQPDSSDNCGALRSVRLDSHSGLSTPFGPISKLCDEGHLNEVLEVVQQKHQQGNRVASKVLFHLVKRCITARDVTAGRKVYGLIVGNGLESDAFLGSHLIHMFELFQSLLEAKQVFNKVSKPNAFSWSAIISAHAKLGQSDKAIQLYYDMYDSSIEPDGHVFVAVLKACTTTAALAHGKLIHTHIIEAGFELHIFVHNTLIHMYVKCGSLENAHMVFDRLPQRDVVSWSALIAGYTHHGSGKEALQLFHQMQQENMLPNEFTYGCILKVCSSFADLEQGKHIHSHIIEHGFESDVFVGNMLVDMYCKCRNLEEAHNVFERLPRRDVVTWNAMIAGYGQLGNSWGAVDLLQQMLHKSMEPDKVTLVCSLKACSSIEALGQGREIHTYAIKFGHDMDILVGNSLIDMYGKCGSVDDAHAIFGKLPERDVVTWSGLIAVYTLHGDGHKALQLFQQMREEAVEPNQVTFICILKACATIAHLEQGKQIHAHIIESGFDSDVFVGSALIDLYGKYGSLNDACIVFERLPEPDLATWNATITCYSQQGYVLAALRVFEKMQLEGMEPNQITVVCILKACSSIAALEQGRQIHCYICESGYESDLFVGNTLIDMYSKCGSLEDACIMFERLLKRDIVTWNAMIAGFAQHSNYMRALQSFKDMQWVGLKPDGSTFLCLFAACDRVGLIDEGFCHFKSMILDYGITPMVEHYNCMIDILGHAGLFNEAQDLLKTIPYQSNIVGWTSLLCSCKTYGNVDLGRQCFEQIVNLDAGLAVGYAIMSNIYADAGMWDDVESIRNLSRSANVWKKPARAFVEIDNQVHEFVVGDKTHPRSDDIYAKLKTLHMQMKEEGYTKQLDVNLDSLLDVEKEDVLCGHCEKLAIAFGLLCTPQGTTIRVAKNLRVCADCHDATKIISRIEMREIFITDAYCIHCFKDGACSCQQ